MRDIFIGRQPILDRNGNLYAYELLHRRRDEEAAVDTDGDRMSYDVLLNAALEVGIEKIASNRPAFINATRNLLLNGCLDAISPENIGLEILETVEVEPRLLARIDALRKHGFTIALDDFTYLPERAALLDHADIVKLDVLALDPDALQRNVALARRRGVKLLAEKVEDAPMYAQARELGFDLFQGYYFARPETYKSQRVQPNKLIYLQLLARVNDPHITPAELSGIIRGDLSMSVTVLRWANSPLYGLTYAIESVERAVVVLGLYTIRNWVSLLALAQMGAHVTELHTTILIRARTCELLAIAARVAEPSRYFTVGLLSTLDVILQLDMRQALDTVPLSPEQKDALLNRSGPLGAALNCVTALESGNEASASFFKLNSSVIARCYFSAIEWVDLLGYGAAPRARP